MQYIKITFQVKDAGTLELLVALLSNAAFEGFEDTGTSLLCYIQEDVLQKDHLQEIADNNQLSFTQEIVAPQNWNAEWERNFEPVIVDDFCTIRADFHKVVVNTKYEIVITPKMSFGTGHHATTCLVIRRMRTINFADKSVLDFGTGTGILAILAEQLGAKSIIAIDNDEWSLENSEENIERNRCDKIEVKRGSLDIVDGRYDIILANINRHILLQYMGAMYDLLNEDGQIVMSGLLEADMPLLDAAAGDAGFGKVDHSVKDGWLDILFIKGDREKAHAAL